MKSLELTDRQKEKLLIQPRKKYRRKHFEKTKAYRNRKYGKKITIDGQAPDIKDLFVKHANGFPLPMVRDEIVIPDINAMLEDKFDLPNPEAYANMDIVDKNRLGENVRQLKKGLVNKIDEYQKQLEKLDKEKQIEEAAQKLVANAKAKTQEKQPVKN